MGLVEGDGLEGSFKGRRVWRRRPGGSLSKQDYTCGSPGAASRLGRRCLEF